MSRRVPPLRLAPLGLVLLLGGCPRPEAPPPITGPLEQRVAAVYPLVQRAAARHRVPEDLVLAVIRVESNFRPRARSRVGAGGLMQLMPRTAASLAKRLGREAHDRFDPEFNVEAGTYYLAYLLRTFDGDQTLALAAYNAGPVRIQRLQRRGAGLPAYSKRYVAAVKRAQRRFSGYRPDAPPPAEETTGSAVASEDTPEPPAPDHDGLRALIKQQRARYGQRPDEALPD